MKSFTTKGFAITLCSIALITMVSYFSINSFNQVTNENTFTNNSKEINQEPQSFFTSFWTSVKNLFIKVTPIENEENENTEDNSSETEIKTDIIDEIVEIKSTESNNVIDNNQENKVNNNQQEEIQTETKEEDKKEEIKPNKYEEKRKTFDLSMLTTEELRELTKLLQEDLIEETENDNEEEKLNKNEEQIEKWNSRIRSYQENRKKLMMKQYNERIQTCIRQNTDDHEYAFYDLFVANLNDKMKRFNHIKESLPLLDKEITQLQTIANSSFVVLSPIYSHFNNKTQFVEIHHNHFISSTSYFCAAFLLFFCAIVFIFSLICSIRKCW